MSHFSNLDIAVNTLDENFMPVSFDTMTVDEQEYAMQYLIPSLDPHKAIQLVNCDKFQRWARVNRTRFYSPNR